MNLKHLHYVWRVAKAGSLARTALAALIGRAGAPGLRGLSGFSGAEERPMGASERRAGHGERRERGDEEQHPGGATPPAGSGAAPRTGCARRSRARSSSDARPRLGRFACVFMEQLGKRGHFGAQRGELALQRAYLV